MAQAPTTGEFTSPEPDSTVARPAFPPLTAATLPMLVVHNSMTRTREPFEPLVPGKVGLYVCGITVYDYCHIGHARMLVAFDGIQRWLRASGYDVTHVRNITDIEDKIIRRAVENGETLVIDVRGATLDSQPVPNP